MQSDYREKNGLIVSDYREKVGFVVCYFTFMPCLMCWNLFRNVSKNVAPKRTVYK